MFTLTTPQGQQLLQEIVRLQQRWADQIYLLLDDKLDLVGNLLTEQIFQQILKDIKDVVEVAQQPWLPQIKLVVSKNRELYSMLGNGDADAWTQWCLRYQVPKDLLGNLLTWSLRPERMVRGRVSQRSIASKGWHSCHCPACGDLADMAVITRETGERVLGCSSCQVSWNYPRLSCLGCGTTDPAHLKYYYLDQNPEQQIHYCTKCQGYLKTIDQRQEEQDIPDLYLTNMMTAHLDLLAAEKGLKVVS